MWAHSQGSEPIRGGQGTTSRPLLCPSVWVPEIMMEKKKSNRLGVRPLYPLSHPPALFLKTFIYVCFCVCAGACMLVRGDENTWDLLELELHYMWLWATHHVHRALALWKSSKPICYNRKTMRLLLNGLRALYCTIPRLKYFSNNYMGFSGVWKY